MAGLALLLAAAGPARAAETPRVERMVAGPVTLDVTLDPPRVAYDRDVVMTLRIEAPPAYRLSLPSLHDRLTGFTLAGQFAGESAMQNGRAIHQHHLRLTPVPHREHRIAPFAVTWSDTAHSPAQEGCLITRPLAMEAQPPVTGAPPATIATVPAPFTVYPSPRAIALGLLGTLAGLALLAALIWGLGRWRHETAMRRLTPRERALAEIEKLLRKRLVERDRVKDFYVELTMIVRRYIERAHDIRAPEQTTEEFLRAATRDARFAGATLDRLRLFLQAADLVKFAAVRPQADDIRGAVATARDYVAHDPAAPVADAARAGKGAAS